MKKLLVVWLFAAIVPFASFGQGIEFDPISFSKLPKAPTTDGSKSLGDIKTKVDLTPYVPEVIHQGNGNNTCGSISTAVYAIGTQRAIARQMTDRRRVLWELAQSPIYVHAKLKNNDCSATTKFEAAAEYLRDFGGVSYADLSMLNCTELKNLPKPNAPFKIKEVQTIFENGKQPSNEIIYVIQKALSQNRPVVVALPLDARFATISKNKDTFYNPTGNVAKSAHAVTIIGFDQDAKKFKLVNSYGPQWGEDGFFYMTYDVLSTVAIAGLTIHLFPESANSLNAPVPVKIGGKFDFKSFNNSSSTPVEVLPRLITSGYYELPKKDWQIGQMFQLFAENTKQGEHICVFSINDKNQINIHWPRDITYNELTVGLGESDLPGQEAKIIIPGSESALVIEEKGTDYLCILYGNHTIKTELQDILKKIQNSSGSILPRVQNALGSRLVKTGVTYSPNKMQFSATPQQGDIVPLILEVVSK
jgi:hypothetical protein